MEIGMKTKLFGISLLVLCGCSSVPEPEKRIAPEDQEWQQLKPSLKRLVALEGDLKLLIGELAALKQTEQTTLPAENVEVDTITKPEFDEKLVTTTDVSEVVDEVVSFAPATATPVQPQPVEVVKAPDPDMEADQAGTAVTAQNESAAVEPEPKGVTDSEVGARAIPTKDLGFALQLASLTSHTAALNTWSRYTLKQQQLTNYLPLIEKVTVNGKLYHRLKLAGFSSKAEAKRLCSDIAQSGIQCYSTNTNGELLQMLASR
jgi:septal ring-binding cell division protein DamX